MLAKAPPVIPAGLPSTLLERRPDIRAAEQGLRAATSRVGSKLAEFFPKFALTGALGVVSNDLSELSNSNNTDGLYSAAATMTWTAPVLGGTAISARYQAAQAQVKEAKAIYERTTLNAFQEVINALVAIERLQQAYVAREKQVIALTKAEKTAMDRYVGGVSSFLDVLTTQDALLIAQLGLAQVQGEQLAAVAQLYRALGGGWNAAAKANAKHTAPTTR